MKALSGAHPMNDRLVGKKELRNLVLYSDAHIARLEAAGQFPKRLRLGNGPRCRVGWLYSEVMAWIESKLPPGAVTMALKAAA
jgi:prophage regulatory protein